MARWNNLVHSQHNTKAPPPPTGWEAGSGTQAPGPPDAGLKTEAGALHFVGLMAYAMA